MKAIVLLLSLTVAASCAAGERRLRLTSSRVDGRNRICVYDDMGSDYIITLPSSRLCERWIMKDD